MKKMYISTFIWVCAFLFVSNMTNAQIEAVDIEVALGESAVYVLLEDGTVRTAGQAVSYGSPAAVNASDLTLTTTLNGYYVLDSEGTVFIFGDAVDYGQPDDDSGNYVDFELSRMLNGYYILSDEGRIFHFGDAIFYGELERDEDAVDLEVAHNGAGYYVLYEDGVIETFGNAVDYGFEQVTRNRAVDIELQSQGYYVAFEDGTLRTFGITVPLPSNQTISEDLVDIALTSRGFRSLTSDGEIRSFMNLETTGQIGWFAQMKSIAPAQATPTPIQTPTPTPAPDEPFFAELPIGFTERVVASLPDSKVLPDVLINGQISLPGGDTYIITTDDPEDVAGTEVRLYDLQLFSDEDFTGELFFSVSPNRTATIRGLSFSELGMIVTVTDRGVTRLVLIEGDFESTEVNGFLNYQ